jgi:DNA-binding MarR family transcriptional regulator
MQYSILANIELAGQLSHTVLADKVGMERSTLTRNLRPLTRPRWLPRRYTDSARGRSSAVPALFTL